MFLDPAAFPNIEPVVNSRINADGERGDPLPSNRQGLYRVLAAGGSAVECGLLDQRSAWPAVLQGLLNTRESLWALDAKAVSVGNIGRSMFTCERLHTVFKRTFDRYEKLDLVILMVGIADLLDWLMRGAPATLPEGEFKLDDAFSEHPEMTFSWTRRGLALKRMASRICWRLGFVRDRKGVGRRFIELRRQRQNARSMIDAVRSPEPLIARFDKYLRLLIRAAHAKGARVLLARQPWLEKTLTPQEDAMMWNFCASQVFFEIDEPADYYTHRLVRELLLTVDAHTSRVAREMNVKTVDLLSALPRDTATYYDLLHFTPQGARQVAQKIAATILEGSASRNTLAATSAS
jgi:lysophospholipase L1-like esterase